MIDRVPGGKSVRRAWNRSVQGAGQINSTAEFLNRVPMYLYLKGKGHSSDRALEIIEGLQFNYGDITHFERKYAKRLFPFYTFSRKMAETTFRDLAAKPGGPLAQMVRASNQTMDNGRVKPDYVAETMSVPWHFSEDGHDTYLTSLGLAHEDTFKMLSPGAGFEALSKMNALVKGPVEYATGQSFFQKGRDLRDLDPTLGRALSNIRHITDKEGAQAAVPYKNIALEQLVMNSPLSRAASSLRKATDPRKDLATRLLDVLTGVKFYTVSPGNKEAIIRERVSDMMRDAGAGHFARTYFRKSDLENMSVEERGKAEALQGLMNELAQAAKERKGTSAPKQGYTYQLPGGEVLQLGEDGYRTERSARAALREVLGVKRLPPGTAVSPAKQN